MQKILILSIIIITLSSCSFNKENTVKENSLDINNEIENKKVGIDDDKKNQLSEAEKKKNKINDLRKKLALKWLIIKWDINLKNKEYTTALIKYLQIHKKLPNDKSTIKKIWDVYFNLKNFKKAYSYYSKIKNYEKLDNNMVSKSLISSVNIKESENIDYLLNELNTLNLSDDELFYYKNSLMCLTDFSLCKKDFSLYFEEKKEENENNIEKSWTWKTNTWSLDVKENEKFKELYNIEQALINYENFQIDDLSYKWALIAWAFYENWLYPISIEVSKIILEDKKDYKPLLKIVAKSYFEIWNYIESKLFLIEYNKLIKKNDPEASYFLWIVYEKLHEYVLSTIHFKKALKNWYENNLDINKRILFNYYELWEIEKMLSIFEVIIKSNDEELKLEDYNLAIYYNIVNEKNDKAKEYTGIAIKKYPDSEIFNWYM